MKVIVLDAGLVGGPMAIDLAADKRFAVTAADINEDALQKLAAAEPKIATKKTDLSDTDTLWSAKRSPTPS